jgi:hypothetical protein
MTYLWTGQRCRWRSISRRVRHRATILRRTDRIAGQRRRAPNTPEVEHHLAARETINPWYHGVQLLQYVCLEISAVCSCSLTAPSVPIRPWSAALRHLNNGVAGRIAFCVARRTEGLLHMGTGLSVLSALQSHPPHSNSITRLYTASSPFSSRAHRHRGTPSDVSRLHILPHSGRPFHPLARSHPQPGHQSRNRGTRTADRHTMDTAHLITQLRRDMARLRPVPATSHAPPPRGGGATFVHCDLEKSTHVLLRQGTLRRILEPSYSDP